MNVLSSTFFLATTPRFGERFVLTQKPSVPQAQVLCRTIGALRGVRLYPEALEGYTIDIRAPRGEERADGRKADNVTLIRKLLAKLQIPFKESADNGQPVITDTVAGT